MPPNWMSRLSGDRHAAAPDLSSQAPGPKNDAQTQGRPGEGPGMLPTVVMGAHPRNPYKPNIQPRPNATGTPTPPMKLPGGSSGAATIDRNAASIKPPPGSLHSPGISIPRPVQRVSKGLR